MKRRRISIALRTAIYYTVAGGLWILLSDRVVALLFPNFEQLAIVQTYKGWFFIAVTALLLFLLVRTETRAQKTALDKYTDLFDSAVEGVFRSTPDGVYVSVNPAMARLYGYDSQQEFLNSIREHGILIHWNRREHEIFSDTLNEYGIIEKFEAQNLRRDGTLFWTSTSARVIKDDHGKVAYYEGFVTDITDQKLAEANLREGQARYKTLLEQMPAAIYTDAVDKGSTNLFSSPQILDMSGYSPQEWAEDPELWTKLIHPEERQRILAENEHTNQTRQPFDQEYRIIARDGRVVWVHDMAAPICDEHGKLLYWQGLLVDITTQKYAEAAIKASEIRYQTLVEQASDAILISDAQGKYFEVNQRACDLLGFSRDELLDLNLHELVPAEELAVRPLKLHELSHGRAVVSERALLRKDGTLVPVEFSTKVLPDGMIMSIARDISERRLAQEVLTRSEQRFRSLIEHSMDAIALCSTDGRILYESPASLRILGYPLAELLGHNVREFTHPDDRERVSKAFEKVLESPADSVVVDLRCLHKDGTMRWVEFIYTNRIDEPGVNAIVANYRDTTERKLAEEALGVREAVLESVSFAAEQFLKSPEWYECLPHVLERMGRSTQTSRVYVFKKHFSADNALLITQIFEWCEAGIEPQINNNRLSSLDLAEAGYARWIHLFNDGLPAYGIVRDLPAEEQVEFVRQSILSILCLPIPVNGDWWGFIGFDDCRTEREWTAVEVESLRAAASTLGAAIQRKSTEEALQRQLKELIVLHSVAMAESSAKDSDELIQRVTDIIGSALYPDNCGVLLSNKCGDGLQPHYSYRGTDPRNIGSIFPVSIGISGKVFRTRVPIRVGDVTQEPAYYRVRADVRSELCVPIISGERALGVLNVESIMMNAFTEADERLLITIAGGMGTAIERLQLFEIEKERRANAERLRRATAALTTTVELEKVFEFILDSLAEIVHYTSASIELIHGECVEIVAERGLPEGFEFIGVRYPFIQNKWGGEFGTPIVIADVQLDDRFVKRPGTEYIRGWIGLPLFVQEKLLGYLNLDSDQVGYFTEEHASLLQIYANQAAIAIDNARLFEEEKRRTKIIEALAEIANEIATTGEMAFLLDKVAIRTGDLLKASHVAIYMLQDDNETIKIVNAHGSFRKELLSHTIRIGEGITGNMIATGKPEIVNDTTKDPRRVTVPGTPEEDGLSETLMLAPLIVRGKPTGSINTWRLRKDGLFNDAELNFLISIAHQTSITIEATRLFQETTRRAKESAAIAEVGRDISATLQLDLVLERIAAYAKELLKAETSAVHLFDPQQELLRPIAAFGKDAEEIKDFPLRIGTGIVGSIAQNKRGEIVNDTTRDPRAVIVEGTEIEPEEHIMAVPVLSRDDLTGLLVVWRTGEDQEFVQSELDFLAALAQQAAVAIQNARLFQAEQKRRQEAENLRIASSAITSSLEPSQVLETILMALQQVVPYDSAAIFQLEGENARITAAKGFEDNDSTINRVFPASNKLFQRVHQTGRPLILEDGQKSPDYENWVAADTVHGWMGVPLISRGLVIGFITMDSYTPSAFDENDAILAQSFAHQAAAAIENSRLFTETRQRMEELEVVSRVSVALRVAPDSEKMVTILLREIGISMDTDTAAIWLYDADKDILIRKAASGGLGRIPKPDIKPGEGIIGKVFLSRKTHVSLDLSRDPDAIPENKQGFGEGWSAITVPIHTTSATIGVVMVAIPSSKRIESHHISLIKTIAEIAGNAINRSNLFEKSEEQVRRLITLREMDTAIASSFDLRVTLDILTEHLLSKMGVSAAAILLLSPDSQTLSYYSGAGFHDHGFLRMQVQASNSLANQILLTQKSVHISAHEQTEENPYPKTLERQGFITYYGVPLKSKGLVRGVLEMYFRESFTPNTDWREFIQTLAGQATIAIDNTRLFENLQRTNQELSLAYDTTLEGWGKALELRDKETEGHTRRVAEMTLELARRMGVPESQLAQIRRGVLLHDIGKMGVPDNILHKEGPLTDEEWIEMRKHPQYAFDLLYPIPYLRQALEIAYYHHEWWDGSGYPSGLKGNDIPLPARIFAVVDVWDALLSNRPYRNSWTKRNVLRYIRELSGIQFDPVVAEAFLEMMKGIRVPAMHLKASRISLDSEVSTPPRSTNPAKRGRKNKQMR